MIRSVLLMDGMKRQFLWPWMMTKKYQ